MAEGQLSYRRVRLVTGIAVICLITIIYIALSNTPRVNLSQVQWSVEDFGHPDSQQAGETSSRPTNATPEASKAEDIHMCSIETRSWKLREVCKALPDPKRHGYPPFLMVDKTHKVLFCILQKCGSTTMRRFFASMKPKFNPNQSQNWRVMRNNGYKLIGDFTNTEKERLLNEYTKAVVVRHPFDRLRSAYYEKFVYSRYIGTEHYNQGIENYRENKTDMSTTMTFREFIKYILDRPPDKHWAPYFVASRPCEINYDYILRLETIDRDLDIFIEEVLKMPGDRLFRRVANHGRYPNGSRLSFDRYLPEFASVSAEDLARLQVMYGKDFEVFGYTWGSNTTGHCSIHVGKDSCC